MLFCRLSTQWRTGGMGGATGLDYTAAYPLIDRLADRASEEWGQLLEDLQTIEVGALEEINRKDD